MLRCFTPGAGIAYLVAHVRKSSPLQFGNNSTPRGFHRAFPVLPRAAQNSPQAPGVSPHPGPSLPPLLARFLTLFPRRSFWPSPAPARRVSGGIPPLRAWIAQAVPVPSPGPSEEGHQRNINKRAEVSVHPREDGQSVEPATECCLAVERGPQGHVSAWMQGTEGHTLPTSVYMEANSRQS